MIAPTKNPQLEDEVHDEALASDAEFELPGIERYTISSFGTDFPVDALYRRLTSESSGDDGDIYIPDFQRGYVWTKPQADRFIESLLLGLPIPGIFLSTDPQTNKRFVIDGSQRLRTIRFFIDGILDGKEYTLGPKVHKDFVGKSYKTLLSEDQRQFNEAVIHATIVRQEEPDDDHRSIYYLFERLNTGGTPAQAHEVRRSLFGGPLNDLLGEIDGDPSWREVFGPPHRRLKDQELVLRFFALYENGASYGTKQKTLKDFLTHFMATNRDIPKQRAQEFREIFSAVIELVSEALGRRAFRTTGGLNTAIFDSVMVALAHRMRANALPSVEDFRNAYAELLDHEPFQSATSTGTSQQTNVRARLALAAEAFAVPAE